MTNSRMELVHADKRRTIHEVVHDLPGGPLTRVTRIDVTADNAVLGNHYHPPTAECQRNEYFVILAGGGTLHTASVDNPAQVGTTRFEAGDSIKVPGNTIHKFTCDAGTVLVVTTDWLHTDGAVIEAELV